MPSTYHFLRLGAVLGAGAVLLQQAVSAFPLKPRQEAGFVLLLLALVVVPVVVRCLMPGAAKRLLEQRNLFVPLAWLIFAEGAVGWLMIVPVTAGVLAPSWPLKVGVLSFSVSLFVVVLIVLRVAYGAWVTTMILDRCRSDLLTGLRGIRHWFWRVFGLEAIGWSVLFIGLAVVIALGSDAMPLALIAMGVGSLLWNLATAALLPVALDDRLRFGQALKQGVRTSWSGKSRWWLPVFAQLLLLGAVTLVSVSYSAGNQSRETTNWSVNAFWTGAYENECRWYPKLMEALDAPTVPLISTALSLLLGALAIAVKIHIVEAWAPAAEDQTPYPDHPGGGNGVNSYSGAS